MLYGQMGVSADHFMVGPAAQFLQHMQWCSLLDMPACPRVSQVVPSEVFNPCSDVSGNVKLTNALRQAWLLALVTGLPL